jgi:hypothetical protein
VNIRTKKGNALQETESALAWQKSTRCDNNQCVEIARITAGVVIRDSTRPDGGLLRFSRRDWESFVAGLSADRRSS